MATCPHSPVECSACRISRRKAERAAESAAPSAAEMGAQLERAKAAQSARAEQAELLARVSRAAALYTRAQEWPRCGQRWPMGAAERAAETLLRDHAGIIDHIGFSEQSHAKS